MSLVAGLWCRDQTPARRNYPTLAPEENRVDSSNTRHSDGLVNQSKASIAWRPSFGGGSESQAPQPERGARPRAGSTPDAASKTLHASGGRFTYDVRPIKNHLDSDHGIYRVHAILLRCMWINENLGPLLAGPATALAGPAIV